MKRIGLFRVILIVSLSFSNINFLGSSLSVHARNREPTSSLTSERTTLQHKEMHDGLILVEEGSGHTPPLTELRSAMKDVQPSPLKKVQQRAQNIPGDNDGWWSVVQEDIRQSEYHVTWQEHTYLPDVAEAYQAPNRAQNLCTYFTSQGIRIIPRVFKGDTAPWDWGLTLSRYGSASQKQEVSVADLNVEENRIEYRRDMITEMYINEESGLRQRVTLHTPPSDSTGVESEVVLDFALRGNLRPHFIGDNELVEFTNEDGVTVLDYGDLSVQDANGRYFPARIELPKPGVLRVMFDTAIAKYPITVNLSMTDPTWIAESDQAYARFGFSVGTAGDVNGDGYSDVIVGAYNYENGQTTEGRAFVYHGTAGGPSTTADWIMEIDQARAYFGYSVGTAGDVNDDGYSDVVVGAVGYENGQDADGGAFVYHGSASGLSTTADWVADFTSLGRSVGTAGDVNGDGYSDVILGAMGYENGQTNEGGAFVYYGSGTGLSTDPDWTAEIDQVEAWFGRSVGTAGDVNGDGYSDVIVGANGYENGQAYEGGAFVYYGSISGLSTNVDWVAESDQAYANFGTSVGTAGDVDGDSYSDVVVGAIKFDNGQVDEGRAYLFHGSSTGLSSTPAWTAESDQTDAYFGASVGTAGDVNGDGYSDVIIGANDYDNGQSDEGMVFLYRGSESGLSANEDWTAESDKKYANFGCSVGTAGDVDSDGYSDVIVGANWYENGQQGEGRAYVYDLVPDFDLTVSKNNDTGGAGTIGTTFHWTIKVSNISEQDATFLDGQTILKDDLPGNATYGVPTALNFVEVTNSENISCAIASSTLNCIADGADVTIGASPGEFDVTFAVTPNEAGDLTNPDDSGVCMVDPDDHLTEDHETNNNCSDNITVNPDLEVTKMNDTGGVSSVGIPFDWVLTVANIGNTPATFGAGQKILVDHLPSDAAFGDPVIQHVTDIINGENITCDIAANTLTCMADGADVTLGANTGELEVRFEVTPDMAGDLVNPETGGVCKVDPDGNLIEYDETNNECTDIVTVTAPDPVWGKVITVSTASEEVNGDVSSPSDLISDPGPDGISLPEAIAAVETTTEHYTIVFDHSLSGSVIEITGGLPLIHQGNLTMDGDIDNDRIPDITIDGSQADDGNGIRINGASDVVIRGLKIQNFQSSGIEVIPDVSGGSPIVEDLTFQFNTISNNGGQAVLILIWNQSGATIRNIEVVSNLLENNQNGVSVTAGIGDSASDNEISGVSLIGNEIAGDNTAISISPSSASGLSRNTVSDIEIRGNRISEHNSSTILIDAANQSDCNDNLVDEVVIADNSIQGLVEFVSVGQSGSNATGNTISNVYIKDNVFPGGAIMFGGATGNEAHDNLISGIVMDRNHISGCSTNGIYLVSGSGGAYENLLENIVIRNTFIGDCDHAGILLHGVESPSHDNATHNVDIANVTLVDNGNSTWAGGLNINTKNASNTITGVTLSNSILWGNAGGDAIRGSLVPDSVEYSILGDDRFLGSNGNFYEDPDFVDPGNGDYSLQSDSPGVDSGDPAATNSGPKDLDNNLRLWDGDGDSAEIVDRGAWEYGAIAAQEMKVVGNSLLIVNGDSVPSTLDGTHFLGVVLEGETVEHIFSIENTGAVDLDLSGSPKVEITGMHASDFTVTMQPPSPVSPGDSSNFSIEFDPSAKGVREAIITIANDDSDENPYTFTVQGVGTAPEIDVQGNDQSIPDGDAHPSMTDDTDFGDSSVNGDVVTHTFTIENTGDANLTVTLPIEITGPDAGDFTVVDDPDTVLSPAGSTTFTVEFDPSGVGLREAEVGITNDDSDENPYNFAIQGTGIAPEMEVEGKGISISDGDSSPSSTDDTDFREVDVDGGTVVHTFTIENTGTAELTLSGDPKVQITGTHAGDFTVTAQPSSPVGASGGTTTFDVTFDPSAEGVRQAEVSIANDDSDEDPYNFAIQGTGVSVTFADVPLDYWAYDYIEALYQSGITGGCGTDPLMYCPSDVVARDQMAVFLERGIHGADYDPPAPTGLFDDVPVDYWAAKWIEALYNDGITGGCGGNNYCPGDPVTRAQMAVFLLRSEHGADYDPPAATGVFNDVPVDHWAADWIEQLAAESITSGCGGGNYCPDDSVTRDQMAVFLARTFNLPIPNTMRMSVVSGLVMS